MVWHNRRLDLCSTWALDLSTALGRIEGSAWEDRRKRSGGQEEVLGRTGGSAREDGRKCLGGQLSKFKGNDTQVHT